MTVRTSASLPEGPHHTKTFDCINAPYWEPQEYSRNIIGIYLPGSLYSLIYSSSHILGVPCLGFPIKSFDCEVDEGWPDKTSTIMPNANPKSKKCVHPLWQAESKVDELRPICI